MSRRLTVGAAVAALTLTVVPAYAASQGSAAPRSAPAATPTRFTSPPAVPGTGSPTPPSGTTPTGTATATTPPAPKPYVPPADAAGAVTATAVKITPEGAFAVRSDPTGKQPLDATWPDASTLFTAKELAQVLPGLTAIRAHDCSTSQITGGKSSAHSTRCTLDLTIKGEPRDNQSKLLVNIRGFGLPMPIGQSWATTDAEQRQRSVKRPGLYTFYKNGSLGAAAAQTDGTTTRALLQQGTVAGQVWFSGIGFAHLKPDYLASRQDYRQRVVPALVQLLAAKLAADTSAG
ncbi:hypothetical protein [Luteipulveratus mongoliensis]|uniref:DUF3558 domain-containing protein n=1 Tax=Luteipulveratus mongoliensis TaxID=571913 RepID=A0A0K1JHS0_9MICO|nr:hypothetical protein [Luteipulveratus mongoliensis]AKU16254.1 hypothetical protein VV02_10905 [Luteipulveratus mongoliensis]